MSKNISLKSIAELQKMQFYIPSYQRGYRWKKQQVGQLIDDICAFNPTESNPFYFLQALAVAKDVDRDRVNVVDGQQRLTTLNLLLGKEESSINIEYAREADQPLDRYFKEMAKETIVEKLGEPNDSRRLDFCKKVEKCCQFLYYEVDIDNELQTFEELNSGKIPAKDSELVKCVMLSVGTDESPTYTNARANEWDEIERVLNNDEFFSFITPRGTWLENDRMTVLFRYAGIIPTEEEQKEEVFPFLSEVLVQLKAKSRSSIWRMVYSAFYRLKEWYNDPLMYHAFGVIVHKRDNDRHIQPLTDKETILSSIKKISGYRPKPDGDDYNNWGNQLFNYLFLGNVAYCRKRWPDRYNFSKHRMVDLWSMEHIFARNQKDLNKEELEDWLGEKFTTEKLESYQEECKKGKGDEWLEKEMGSIYPSSEDNSIRNLALLPRNANSSLNNKLFEGKRKEICDWANKQWKPYWIPPVTEAVFLKSLTGLRMTLPYWSEHDKQAYLRSIEEDIKDFIEKLNNSEAI